MYRKRRKQKHARVFAPAAKGFVYFFSVKKSSQSGMGNTKKLTGHDANDHEVVEVKFDGTRK